MTVAIGIFIHNVPEGIAISGEYQFAYSTVTNVVLGCFGTEGLECH